MKRREMRCPAYPMCSAFPVVTFPEKTMLGTIPDHIIMSGPMEGERCAASGSRITWVGDIRRGDRNRILAAGEEWVRRSVRDMARDESQLDADVEQSLRGLLQVDGGAPLGRPADQPTENYFPGRPADAPEPGIGERPAGLPPMNLGGGFLGRARVDNARDQLRTLLAMAIEKMAAGQDTLAKMTALVDSVAAQAEVVRDVLTTANHLVTAAIGSGGDVPEPAMRLQGQLAAAVAAVTTTEDGLTMALRVKIEQTFSQVASAVEAAREYQSIP